MDHQVWRALAFGHVLLALLLVAKTRTTSLIFILLCALMVLRNVGLSWCRLLPLPVVGLLLAGGARYVTGLSAPAQAQMLVARHQLKSGISRRV